MGKEKKNLRLREVLPLLSQIPLPTYKNEPYLVLFSKGYSWTVVLTPPKVPKVWALELNNRTMGATLSSDKDAAVLC